MNEDELRDDQLLIFFGNNITLPKIICDKRDMITIRYNKHFYDIPLNGLEKQNVNKTKETINSNELKRWIVWHLTV